LIKPKHKIKANQVKNRQKAHRAYINKFVILMNLKGKISANATMRMAF